MHRYTGQELTTFQMEIRTLANGFVELCTARAYLPILMAIFGKAHGAKEINRLEN